MTRQIKTDDASGRGAVAGFKVPFPGRMHGYTEEGIKAVSAVMRKAEGQTQGAYLRQFEADFTAYTGANHVFAVDNATNALRLAAVLCRLGKGAEVIIPAYTFCATAIPFGKTGARIVWADIDPRTWVADPDDIERKITSKTRAIMVVHLLGMPVDMPRVMKIARKHNLKVVEDCAQAPGAAINGRRVGTFGDFGCFSWHGAKNMTTLGEGGMLTVKSHKDAALVPGLRHNGVRAITGKRQRYWVPAMSTVDIDIEGVWPNNFCLGEAQCALGSVELRRLDAINAMLISQAEKIKVRLADTAEIEFARIPSGYKHIFHQFIMHFNGRAFNADRNDLMDILVNDYRIRCIVQYCPLYRFPLFQKMGFGRHNCPVLDAWWDNSFSFPWWCGMPGETIDYLCNSTKAAIAKLKGLKK
ncbi:MAG: DegT/DnrJ/EryC1/StrS family aminotransferase [Kiritimatiellaeota bacterium]|nr:DegT/DnrJ/EryC1/StrS family aminotransferase [Kiritimatiellota bacterium]